MGPTWIIKTKFNVIGITNYHPSIEFYIMLLAARISPETTGSNTTMAQANVTAKIKDPITRSYSPRDNEGHKYAALSINRHCSCGSHCNRQCGYYDS